MVKLYVLALRGALQLTGHKRMTLRGMFGFESFGKMLTCLWLRLFVNMWMLAYVAGNVSYKRQKSS